MLRSLSSRKLSEWMAFEQLEAEDDRETEMTADVVTRASRKRRLHG